MRSVHLAAVAASLMPDGFDITNMEPPMEEQKTDKPWKPTRIEMTASTPLRIRTLAEREWFNGESGEKARGLIYDTGRRVEDDKANGIRTIVHASRRERMAATPVGERFSAQVRAMFAERRKAMLGGAA